LVLPGISCSLVSSQLHLIEKLLNEFQAALQSLLGAGLGTPGPLHQFSAAAAAVAKSRQRHGCR